MAPAREARRLGLPRDGLAIVLITATMFLNLYPRVMPSSIDAAYDLTIWNAGSSTHYTLTVMTWWR